MKRIGMISTVVLSLALGVAASAFAQEQRDQQEEQKAKPAQEEKKAQPEKSTKQEQKPAAQKEKAAKPEEKNAQQQSKDTRNAEKQPAQQQHAQQAQPEKQEQRASGNAGARIPDDRFKANFGEQHRFRVTQADYSRDRRFQYGGYWFGFADAWPSNWLYTQDVFVIEINGVYYLCNPMFPGVNIALNIVNP
jgi:type IV secretory pathway VirB10-like protein